MTKKIVAASVVMLLAASAALAQGPSGGGGPGPGPVPSPWIVNGPTLSYNNGGVTLPASVTGGTKGVGTFNVSGGYYVNNVLIGQPGGSSGQIQVNSGTGGFSGLTNTELTARINLATTALSGALPAWPNNSTTFLRGDGTYTQVGNSALVNSSITIGSTSVSLGGTAASISGLTLASPTFSGTVAGSNTIPLTILAQSAANTMLGNWSGSTANVLANSMPSCPDTGTNHLNYVSGTGITCGTASGNAITALTGDATATGPGSVAITLATVNSNVGSFGSSTAIPSFTVNGKGLVTAASTNAVVAPAGTLTGTTLTSNVVTSSLTSVGALSSGSLAAGFTAVPLTIGGSGQTTAMAARGSSGFNVDQLRSTGDANYTILAADRMLYHTALSAARTDTLPAANAVNAGQVFVISDFAGVASASNTITLQRAGSDTINGATSVVAIALQYGAGVFWSDGSTRWTYLPAGGGGGGSGTVTNIATTYPIGGGTITTTGTLTSLAPTTSGYLTVTSTTQLTFGPNFGDVIKIAGVVYQIPSAGVTTGCTNTGSASTLYYVYVFNNSGTLNCELSTTGHSTSATAGNIGTEIKTGDGTRSLVGMVWMNGSNNFIDAQTVSWFNRKYKSLVPSDNETCTGTCTVGTFVTWANETVVITGPAYGNNTSSAVNSYQIDIDGVQKTQLTRFTSVSGVLNVGVMTNSWTGVLTEGKHTANGVVSTNSGTNNAQVSLFIGIRG